jgi:hypothetical protein
VHASIVESQAGSGDEVANGAGHKDFAGLGATQHARRDVHGDPGDVATDQFILTRVQAGAGLAAQLVQVAEYGLRDSDSTGSVTTLTGVTDVLPQLAADSSLPPQQPRRVDVNIHCGVA